MTRPLIAIPGRRSDEAKGQRTSVVLGGRRYADAVQRAGGLPVVVPPTDDVDLIRATVERCDGMVLLGGGDVSPAQYSQEITARLFGVDEFIDDFEIAAVQHAVTLDLPVLAICRGHQILNVAMGGTLIQHLENFEVHRDTMHDVQLTPGSLVAEAMGTTQPITHSFHHQAIDTVAPSLTVVGHYSDGTIEAVQHTSATWVIGVQWHPEDTAETDSANQGLFNALVKRATRR
jgi:putative glutamine amidotransferase